MEKGSRLQLRDRTLKVDLLAFTNNVYAKYALAESIIARFILKEILNTIVQLSSNFFNFMPTIF